jgi:amino acid transporter
LAKLVPLILFIGAGLFFITPANLALAAPPSYPAFSTAVLVLVYAFTGFENASVPAGEIVNPRRNMPFAILIGIGIVTLIYLLIQTVAIGTLPNLGSTQRPLADAASNFLGPLGASIIAAGAVISVIGNLNVNILTTPRMLFAMSSRHELPQIFSTVHKRFRTPHLAIVVTAGLMLALTLSSSLIYALTVSTIARLLAYAATCAALPTLRRKKHAPPALVKIPGGGVISLLAILLSIWLLSNGKRKEVGDAAIAVAAGIVVYLGYRLSKRRGEISES